MSVGLRLFRPARRAAPPPEFVSDTDLATAEVAGLRRARTVWARLVDLPFGQPIGPRTRSRMMKAALAISDARMVEITGKLKSGRWDVARWHAEARAETAAHLATLMFLQLAGSPLTT